MQSTGSTEVTTCPPIPGPPQEVQGLSGRRYAIEKILQDKKMHLGRVYLASDGVSKFVVKEVPQDYAIRTGIYEQIGSCQYLRSLRDKVPDHRMFVFDYLDHNLLHFAQGDVSLTQRKHILKCVLKGIEALHSRHIVHKDVKPTNIFLNVEETDTGPQVEQVQLVDLENAANIGPDCGLTGAQLGNWMWRSPEAYAEGPMGKLSDMFSFGLVCIYAVTKCVIMAVDRTALPEGTKVLDVVLRRHLSHFANPERYEGFMRCLDDDNPWRQKFDEIRATFNKASPRQPVSTWEHEAMDDDFRDLITGLTNFDPQKRLTAQQALEHKWFSDDVGPSYTSSCHLM